jgi:predicted GNAT family acetyltransferase
VVRAAAERITGYGERAFLHVAADNVGARRLAFAVRRHVRFRGYRVP